jgi:hypothetical protein
VYGCIFTEPYNCSWVRLVVSVKQSAAVSWRNRSSLMTGPDIWEVLMREKINLTVKWGTQSAPLLFFGRIEMPGSAWILQLQNPDDSFLPLQQLRTWNSSHSCTILFTYNFFTHSYTCALEDSAESSSRRELHFGFLAIILVILNLFLSSFLSLAALALSFLFRES